jgi:hypothetical protein
MKMLNLECRSDLIVFSFDQFGSQNSRTSKQMEKFALNRRVYFIESPIIGVSKTPTYFLKKSQKEVIVIQPYLPEELSIFEQKVAMLDIIKELITDENISHYTLWTDTPKAMPFIRNLSAEIIVYDCLRNYSITHPELEQELFQYADVVLTSALTEKKIETAPMKVIPLHWRTGTRSTHSHL